MMEDPVRGSKFLCSQVVAPIRNEDGDICMFIVNFEDVTDAPYKADEESSARVPPLPPPTVRPSWHSVGRSRSLRLRLPGSRRTSFALTSPPPLPEAVSEETSDETLALRPLEPTAEEAPGDCTPAAPVTPRTAVLALCDRTRELPYRAGKERRILSAC
ncbi:hypothetical protein ISCGN_018221 [Ixodes scapularis]